MSNDFSASFSLPSGDGHDAQGLFSPLLSPPPDKAYRQLASGTRGAYRLSKNESRSAPPQVGRGSEHVAVLRSPSGTMTISRAIVASPTPTGTDGGNNRNVPRMRDITSGRQFSEQTFDSTGSFSEFNVWPAELSPDPTVKGRAKKAFKSWAKWAHILELAGLVAGGIAIYATHASVGAILGQIIIPIPGVGLVVGGLVGASLSTAAAATLGGILNLVILQFAYSGLVLGAGAIHRRGILKSEENRLWRGQQRQYQDDLQSQHDQLITDVPDEAVEAGADLLLKLEKCVSKNKKKRARRITEQINTNLTARRAFQSYNVQAKQIEVSLPDTRAANNIRVKYRNRLNTALSEQRLKDAEQILKSFSLDAGKVKRVHRQSQSYQTLKKEHESLSSLLSAELDPTRDRRSTLLVNLRRELNESDPDSASQALDELRVCLSKARKTQSDLTANASDDSSSGS